MPEIKNTFIKSKMNKDLDDRLLSNGEYRNAQNVNISRSEGEDVGALENVLGNKLLSSVTPTQTSEIIGYIKDDINNCVYTFSTNYTDTSSDELSNPAPYGAECKIVKTDLSTGTDSNLVKGRFLNLSKTHPIYGVNLLEDLLFWTDDRNQPRKINVKKVSSLTYYSTEDTISVAKYYPYKVPKLYDEVSVNVKSSLSEGVPTFDFKNFVTLADVKKLKAGMMLLRGGDSNPSNPTSTLERFIIAVFQGSDTTSYFLTNRSIITTNNTVVAFGFSNSKNSFKKYLDYSIIGAAVRYDANVTLGLRQVNYTVSSQSNMVNNTSGGGPTRTLVSIPFTTNGSGSNATIDVQVVGGSIANVIVVNPGSGYAVGDTITITAAQIAFAFITQTTLGSNYTVGSVLNVLGNGSDATALVGSTSGKATLQSVGIGYINGSNVTLPAPIGSVGVAGFTYNFGSGSLVWTLSASDFINVDAPTAKTFFWSGSSIPYTKMLVNCPGFTSPDTIITSAAYQGAAPDGVVYYKITTNINHNIPTSTVINSVAMVELSWPNPNYNSAFTGDSELLKEKFVRFAYRFKFDDGEYSLISPFTQPVFMPKQRGFIQEGVSEVALTLAGTSSGNVTGTPIQNFATGEEDIQASTIVSFFENSIDTISLQIEMPYPLGDSNDPNTLDIKSKLGVVEIDILYKESDGLAVKIVDTIPSEIFRLNEDDSVNTSNIFTYNYESKEPFKLVSPTKEIERVYDKVPIRALAQESAGNRIIYGNFIDKHTAPSFLKYNVRIAEKEAPTISNITNSTVQVQQAGKVISNSYLSYPTHTIKQNRNYQVGFVLSDKYGRQSDVVLAPLDNRQYKSDEGNILYEGSTIFNPYFGDTSDRNVATWRGDMLEILLREAIPSTATADGYPGIYKSGRYDTTLGAATVGYSTIITCNELDPNVAVGDIVVIQTSILAVTAVDFTTKKLTLSGAIAAAINTDVEIYGPENKLGWYSYKVVVKQLTQDYYNAYLGNVAYLSPASALANNIGNYPFSGSSFVTSLLSDNVNKIPADLIQVAPEQNQFGTSDALLYPRVGGTVLRDNQAIDYIYATNFHFGAESASINAYGKIRDIGVAEVTLDTTSPYAPNGFKSPIQSSGVQSASSDPTAIILTMPNAGVIGRAFWRSTGLYVFEVGALKSKIEIFWETSTCGLVSDLNNSVATGPSSSVVDPNAPITPGVPADDSVPA